jgi:Fe-S-cluster containining protein
MIHEPTPSALSEGDVRKCQRCATCCRKGGPAFHRQDRHLIESGRIPSEHLFTIRRGEPVHDNVKGQLASAPQDIIKIRSRSPGWTCFYLDENTNACTVYALRPLECRLLKCWEPEALALRYNRERLTRRDLLKGQGSLWELITDHQRRCDYSLMTELIKRLRCNEIDSDARGQLSLMIHYDREIRHIMVSRAALSAQRLDFLFGRPLTTALRVMGIAVTRGREGKWQMTLQAPSSNSQAKLS